MKESRVNPKLLRNKLAGRGSLLIFTFGIIAYAVGATVGPQFHFSFLLLGYTGAALMLAVSFIGLVERKHEVIPEILMLWVFCLWAVLTGFVTVQNFELFFRGSKRLLQIALVAFCVAGASVRLRSPSLGFFSMLVVALLLGIYGEATGDFDSFGEVIVVNATRMTGVRASSMVQNANTLGVNAVWGLVAVTYFTGIVKRRGIRAILWICVPLLVLSMLASGSRKALALPIIYLVSWVWFCHRKYILRKWQSSIPVVVLGALLVWGLPWVMENTFLGYRMRGSIDENQKDGSTEARMTMNRQAVEAAVKHPVMGIGLSQWSVYHTHSYAHNEYGELAATTGFIGLGLYLIPYLMSVRRLCRIRRIALRVDEYTRAGVCLALLFTLAAAGVGQVLFSGQTHWLLVGAVWGYAFGEERFLSGAPNTLQNRQALHAC